MKMISAGETYKYLGEEYTVIGRFADKDGNNPLIVVHLAANSRPEQPFLALNLKSTGTQVFRIEGDQWAATSLPPIEGEPPAWAIDAAVFSQYGPVVA